MRSFDFIGMQFNTHTFTIAALPKMRHKVQSSLEYWRQNSLVLARELHRLLSIVTYMVIVVTRDISLGAL